MNPLIEKILEHRGDGKSALVDWCDFIEFALYDDQFGYYKRDKLRVGSDGADFYTASSLKQKVFSELIEESAKSLLARHNADLKNFKFIEIGAEGERQIIEGSRAIRLGEKIDIPQNAIVISNELLDAQPFTRFRFDAGIWKKRQLKISRISDSYSFAEELEKISEEENEHLKKYFPQAAVEGFSLDISFDAIELFDKICSLNWWGTIIFADYYRTARELSELPLGTARSYFKHIDSSDITQNVGLADITFSPCSDTLLDVAKARGFSDIRIDFQSNFFVEFSANKIREIIETKEPLNLRKRELSELISPANMGAAFRVLSAIRL